MTQDMSGHLRKSLQYGNGAAAVEDTWLRENGRKNECDNCHARSLGRMSYLFWQDCPFRICRQCLDTLVKELRAKVASGRDADEVRAEIFGRMSAQVDGTAMQLELF